MTNRPNIPNARFWTWENNGWVKITLRPRQELIHSRYSRDEEGWSATHNIFRHEETRVVNEWQNEGKDCDGYLSRSGLSAASLDQLATRLVFTPGGVDFKMVPAFEEIMSWQRDDSAIAAGY